MSVADDKNLCDFYFPSIIQKENIVMGINSGGQSPKQTKEIRKKIEDILEAESFYERKWLGRDLSESVVRPLALAVKKQKEYYLQLF